MFRLHSAFCGDLLTKAVQSTLEKPAVLVFLLGLPSRNRFVPFSFPLSLPPFNLSVSTVGLCSALRRFSDVDLARSLNEGTARTFKAFLEELKGYERERAARERSAGEGARRANEVRFSSF